MSEPRPLTLDELDKARARHRPVRNFSATACARCGGFEWPCMSVRLLATLDERTAERDEARDLVDGWERRWRAAIDNLGQQALDERDEANVSADDLAARVESLSGALVKIIALPYYGRGMEPTRVDEAQFIARAALAGSETNARSGSMGPEK